MLAAALAVALSVIAGAQYAGRGAIQTPTGGRGPGAAPDANDPANANADLSPKPPVVPLTPAEQAARFWLPPGYRMEPLLAEPIVEDPAQIAFDGNGRMFVVELRGYVQTPDGIDLIPPIGRISMHQDRDNDGTYEHHTVFVDKMVFPRFVLPFGANTILTMETNADEVWKYTDTNADGVADKKELFTTNFGRAGNMESQQSSLFWAMDNWMYSTVNAFRLRWTPNGVLKEPTGPNSSQWGVTQDDDGKVWFQGGASGMPGYFQFPVHYGNFAPPDQFEPDLNIMWGAPILIGDIQAGLPGTRLPDGSLIYATAGAGNEVYRGDRMPKDLLGDYLYGEEVSRTIRRLRPVKTDGSDAIEERLHAVRVHSIAGPALPPGGHDDRSGRDDLHRRHVSRHHRGRGVGKGRDVSSRQDQAVPVGQGGRARPRLASLVRRDRTRQEPAADADGNAGATGRAPVASERLVARHGAAAPRAETGQDHRAGAPAADANVEERGARASTRSGRSKGSARSMRRSPVRFSRIPSLACGFRRCAPARRSTRRATDRSPTTTARSPRTPTSTSSFRRC